MVWVRTLDPHPKTHGKWNKQTLKPNYNLFLAKFQWFFSQQKLWVLFWGEGEIRRSGGLEGEMLMKFGGEFRSFTPFGWGKGEDFGGSKNQMNIWSHLPWASPSFVPFYSNQLPSQIQLAIPQTIQLWDNQISAHLGRFTTFFASHLPCHLPKINPSRNRFASDGKDQVSTRSIGLKELLLGSRNLHTKSIQDRCPARHPRKGPFFWGRKPSFFQNACAGTSRKRWR